MSARQFISKSQATPPFYVGIDLGGTTMKAGVVDDNGRPLSWDNVVTEAGLGPDGAMKRLGELVLEVIRQAGLELKDVARVGLGSAGPMDLKAGILVNPPNLPGWDGFPIVARLEQYCGLPVTFANDAGAAAFGEYWQGAARDWNSLVLFTLGTGVGCGIIIDDLSIDGENSHGAECGHIVIDCRADARECSCGKFGHLEAYASATAVVKRTLDALAAGRKSSLAARLEKGEELTPRMVNHEAENGDELSLEIVFETAAFLGVGVTTLIHTIDPTGVLIGGAMTFGGPATELGRRFIARVREEVQLRAFPIPAERVKIEYATLGGDAGYIGAAGLARVAHRRGPKP